MAAPTITALPTAPNLGNPETYPTLAQNFAAALPQFRTDLQALADYLDGLVVGFVDDQQYAVQSSATDQTADRILQVGAFGLGAVTPPSVADADDAPEGSITKASAGTNSPDGTAGWVYLTLGVSATGTIQMAFSATDASIYTRYEAGSVWTSWKLVHKSGITPYAEKLTIADDAVGTIDPPRDGGFMNLATYTAGGTTVPWVAWSGILWYDSGGTLNIVESSFTSLGANLDVSTSNVTGTTGTDTNVTVAVQSGVIKIENRSGATRDFYVTLT